MGEQVGALDKVVSVLATHVTSRHVTFTWVCAAPHRVLCLFRFLVSLFPCRLRAPRRIRRRQRSVRRFFRIFPTEVLLFYFFFLFWVSLLFGCCSNEDEGRWLLVRTKEGRGRSQQSNSNLSQARSLRRKKSLPRPVPRVPPLARRRCRPRSNPWPSTSSCFLVTSPLVRRVLSRASCTTSSTAPTRRP